MGKSINISKYLNRAVTSAKGFITNKISSHIGNLGLADLVSQFGATSVNSNDTGAVAQLLDKSPFTPKKSTQQAWKDQDKLGFRHIQYPLELTGNELGNWMLFFMISNAGGDQGGVMDLKVANALRFDVGYETTGTSVRNERTGASTFQADAYSKIRQQYADKGIDIPDVNMSNFNLPQQGKRLVTGAVALYMPPDIKVSYGQEWAPEDTNTSGDLAHLIKKLHGENSDENIIETIAQSGFNMTLKMFKNAIGATTETLGLGDIVKVYGKHKGWALNTHKEQFYEGPTFREFTYQFKFWPRNQEETRAAQEIVLLFKYHMHPWKDSASEDRLFRVPSEFEIHYLHNTGRNKALPRISRCALKKVDVSYTPEGGNFKTFDDHAPVCYTLDLNFVELEYMTKDKIFAGF